MNRPDSVDLSDQLPDLVDRPQVVDLLRRCPFLWYRWYPFVKSSHLVAFHADRIVSAARSEGVRTMTTIENGRLGGLLQVTPLAWDTGHFGLKMASVPYVYGAGDGLVEPTMRCYQRMLGSLDEYCREQGIAHLSLTADGEDIRLIQAANLARFVVAGCNTNHFFIPSRDRKTLPPDLLAGQVRGLLPGDLEQLVPFAGGMFRWTRFHADPWLDGHQSDQLYTQRLVQLCIREPSTSYVYVVEKAGRPVAIMPVRKCVEAGIKVALLDLTIILPEARGLYYYLLVHVLHHVNNVDVIEFSTDSRNLVVRNTWAQLRLQCFSTRFYLHKCYQDIQP